MITEFSACAAVDRRGRLVKLLLTPGQRGDAPKAEALLAGLERGTVGHVIAPTPATTATPSAGGSAGCGPGAAFAARELSGKQ